MHFPVACWSLVVLADFASLRFGEGTWSWSAGLLAVGCATGVAAMLAGVVELARVPEGAAMRDAYLHMGAMLTALTLFAIRFFLRLDHLKPLAPDALSLVLDTGGFLALAVGGWLGGKLVYGHGVGRK